MVVIYWDRPTLERFIATMPGVQRTIAANTRGIAAAATANLAQHRSEGHSFIETAFGDIDGYVILNDTRGLYAAMSIEFGRGPGDGPGDPFPNGTTGTFVLHRAAGLTPKRVRPNSRRKKKYVMDKRRKRR